MPLSSSPIDDANLPDPGQTDRLSGLPDALLAAIIWLLPTRVAAHTSVLSRRFRDVWNSSSASSPSLELIGGEMPRPRGNNFLSMADHLLLGRDADAHPLLISLRLKILCDLVSDVFLSSILLKVCSFNSLRHLACSIGNIRSLFSVLLAIFSMETLESLSIKKIVPVKLSEGEDGHALPSGTSLIRLRSLSLDLDYVCTAQFHRLISELPSSGDLSVVVKNMEILSITSDTIRKLKLIVRAGSRLETVMLCLPSLELLPVGNKYVHHRQVPQFQGAVTLLRKVVVKLDYLSKEDCSDVAGLLNFVSHVEELTLHIREDPDEKNPFHVLLEPGKEAPDFPNLKLLEATMCFHEHHFEAIVSILRHSPALESVKLVHEHPESYTFGAIWRKRNEWASRLPLNADCNRHCGYFTNLHLGENRKQFGKILNKK